MGISTKIQNVSNQLQTGVKNSTVSLFGLVLKVLSSFFVALTLALLTQFMMQFKVLGFLFALVAVFATLLRLMWPWSIKNVVIFDVICFLLALVCHLYVDIAPGVGQ